MSQLKYTYQFNAYLWKLSSNDILSWQGRFSSSWIQSRDVLYKINWSCTHTQSGNMHDNHEVIHPPLLVPACLILVHLKLTDQMKALSHFLRAKTLNSVCKESTNTDSFIKKWINQNIMNCYLQIWWVTSTRVTSTKGWPTSSKLLWHYPNSIAWRYVQWRMIAWQWTSLVTMASHVN